MDSSLFLLLAPNEMRTFGRFADELHTGCATLDGVVFVFQSHVFCRHFIAPLLTSERGVAFIALNGVCVR